MDFPLDLLLKLEYSDLEDIHKLNERGLKEYFVDMGLPDIGFALLQERVTGKTIHLLTHRDIDGLRMPEPTARKLTTGEQLVLRNFVAKVRRSEKFTVQNDAIWEAQEYQKQPIMDHKIGPCADATKKFFEVCCCFCCSEKGSGTEREPLIVPGVEQICFGWCKCVGGTWKLKPQKYILTNMHFKLREPMWYDGFAGKKRPKTFSLWCGCPCGYLSCCTCCREDHEQPHQKIHVNNIDLGTVLDVDCDLLDSEVFEHKDPGCKDCYECCWVRSWVKQEFPPAELYITYKDTGDLQAAKKTVTLYVDPAEAKLIERKFAHMLEEHQAPEVEVAGFRSDFLSTREMARKG